MHDLVQRAHAALMPTSPLDLATLSRTFTLQCHDSVTSAISPGLIVHLETLAPHVSLRILAESSVDTNELRHGNVDLEISSSQPAQPEIVSETIGHGQLVVAMRKDHPLTLRKLTIARYASARHITVSRRGRLSDPIDEALTTLGKQRRVVASAPTSSAALEIVAQSDLIACVVQGTCAPMICRLAIPTTPMPLKIAPVPMNMSWHRRYSTDIEHQWFREVVRRELAGVCDFPG